MRIVVTFLAILATSPAAALAQKCSCEPSATIARSPAIKVRPQSALRPESPSFVIRSYHYGPEAAEVASTCKSLRKQLQETWLGEPAVHDWLPPCEIVLHATRTSYSQAVGEGAAQTTGSTVIRCQQKRITTRRIDLLVDNKGRLPALAHELTHVVLADRFVGRQPPLWADEGMAVLADSASKRALHHRDCVAALRDGTALRVADLVRLEQFTSPSEVAAFYGQSQSLVQFLIDRRSPSRFVQFLTSSIDQGYDRALREVYEIEDTRQLEKLWQRYALSKAALANDVVVSHPKNVK